MLRHWSACICSSNALAHCMCLHVCSAACTSRGCCFLVRNLVDITLLSSWVPVVKVCQRIPVVVLRELASCCSTSNT